jgi:hypothetical protein
MTAILSLLDQRYLTTAKLAIAKKALQNEHESDILRSKGYATHAYGTQTAANRLWDSVFDHLAPDGAHLDRRGGR